MRARLARNVRCDRRPLYIFRKLHRETNTLGLASACPQARPPVATVRAPPTDCRRRRMLVEDAGLRPNRSHSGWQQRGPSACSIVTAALEWMGEHLDERTVEGIWNRYRRSPQIIHLTVRDWIRIRYPRSNGWAGIWTSEPSKASGIGTATVADKSPNCQGLHQKSILSIVPNNSNELLGTIKGVRSYK